MATKTLLVDDIDGSQIEEDDEGGSQRFTFKGRVYEIDLSAKNLEKMEEALLPFISAARDITPGGKRTGDPATLNTDEQAREDTRNARAWAQDKGRDVAAKGRISAEIMDAWRGAGSPKVT